MSYRALAPDKKRMGSLGLGYVSYLIVHSWLREYREVKSVPSPAQDRNTRLRYVVRLRTQTPSTAGTLSQQE